MLLAQTIESIRFGLYYYITFYLISSMCEIQFLCDLVMVLSICCFCSKRTILGLHLTEPVCLVLAGGGIGHVAGGQDFLRDLTIIAKLIVLFLKHGVDFEGTHSKQRNPEVLN